MRGISRATLALLSMSVAHGALAQGQPGELAKASGARDGDFRQPVG
ncbi:hypothetical protein [Sphingobium sp. YR768]|nr:hypothetical protein SAMN05518866_10592 [Sphingobium sp. YR768]